MPLVRFHHLTLEAHDLDAAGRFWQVALGYRPVERTEDRLVLAGQAPYERFEVHRGEHPRRKPHRIHLDLHTDRLDDLQAAGGRLLGSLDDADGPWQVMLCPEGREVAVLVGDQPTPHAYGLYQMVVDTPDPERAAAWWARALGTTLRPVADDPDVAFIEPVPHSPLESLVFARESVAKTVPNSCRLALTTYDTDALELTGAIPAGEDETHGTVMTDPFGTDFEVITLART